jgi:hypothetical protein
MTQRSILALADAYADAAFDQGLHQRKVDAAPELERQKLADEVASVLRALKLVARHIPEIIALGILSAAETDSIRAAIAKATGETP